MIYRKPKLEKLNNPLTMKTSALSLFLMVGATCAQPQTPAPLGNVSFETTCVEDADAAFEEGLTLLHHMMYFQADAVFDAALSNWPDCAMLGWGVAMSKFHPLWPGKPTDAAITAGLEGIQKMQSAAPGSALEQSFAAAVSEFYADPDASYADRKAAWATAQAATYAAFPDNDDATAFYALSLIATAPRGDKTLAQQRKAGALMEELSTTTSLHPGVHHYAIHAYDNPALYTDGLDYAQAYGGISPNVPHALHMPSHIFVRAGRWDDVVDWNVRSAKAALAQPLGDVISSHHAHAMDYLIYAHLQRGEFGEAKRLLAAFLAVENQQANFGSAYALAASPARVALETDDWQAAAQLSTSLHPAIAWEKFPQAKGMIWFAKGLGAIRSGDSTAAQDALQALAELRAPLVAGKQGYWLQLLDAQAMSIEAWIELDRGNTDLALALQGKAAEIEDAAGKSPVTPGHVIPARELLGDMLRQIGQDDLAADAYRAVLENAPNRRRSTMALK